MKKAIFGLLFLSAFSVSAYAENLLAVYEDAVRNDPTLAEARATQAANSEAFPQAIAGLLPNASASASTTSIHNSDNTVNSVSGASSDNSVNQHSYILSLTQPIFNLQNWMQVRAANNTAKQAEATYNAAVQDLIVRVSTAYFNVLEAEDNLRFTIAEEKATANQLKQINEKFQVGLATKTDVYQAKASYDSLVAQEIVARNEIANNMEALRQITGVSYSELSPLIDKVPLISPAPDDVNAWISASQKNNWSLLAARFAEQSSKETVRVNYAQHFPTVNAVGQYENGNNLAFTQPSSTEWQSNVGVQVSMPLFEGGLINSQTRQAQDQYVASSDQMEVTHRQVVFDTEQSFNNVVAGISAVEADRIAVISAQSALDSTNAAYEAGTKTILDVLTAQQNLFQAQATLAKDQYAYINNTLALKQASGSLNAGDVIAISHWLKNE